MSQDIYSRIERAMAYIADHTQDQPALEDIAASACMSPFHFQRLFSRWVGVSPKKFLQYLTLDYAKARLAESASVLDAAYDAGLSGPSRLHDLFVTHEAVTPGEHKQHGAGLAIDYGFHHSPFGECLLMATDRGICGLAFVTDGDRAAVLTDMTARWPRAQFVERPAETAPLAARIFEGANGAGEPLRLWLHGTNFQIRVWEALLRIPSGALVTYADIAASLGTPRAARAIGTAVGRNPISYLIPCHRAILKTGVAHNYAWGRPRKLAMIGWEAAHGEVGSGASEAVAAAI